MTEVDKALIVGLISAVASALATIVLVSLKRRKPGDYQGKPSEKVGTDVRIDV